MKDWLCSLITADFTIKSKLYISPSFHQIMDVPLINCMTMVVLLVLCFIANFFVANFACREQTVFQGRS